MQRKKIIKLAALAVSGLLLFTGCGRENASSLSPETIPSSDNSTGAEGTPPATQGSFAEPKNTEASGQPSKDPNPSGAPAAPVVSILQEQKEWYTEDGQTPLLTVNSSIVTIENQGCDALRRAVTQSFPGIRDNYEDMLEQAEAFYEEQQETNPLYFSGYSLTSRAELCRSDTSVTSFRVLYSDYMGGAHGNYGYKGITFDTADGRELTLTDLLTDAEGFYEKAAAYLSEKLEADYAEDLFPDYRESVEASLKDEYLSCWYLDGAGITMVYSPYFLGPYALGTVEITLPYGEFDQYIKEDYRKPQECVIARVPINEDFSALIGEESPATVSLTKEQEYGEVKITLLSGSAAQDGGSYARVVDAYVIKKADGRSFLALVCDYASDDFELSIYELTGGKVEKCDELSGASLDGSHMAPDRLGIAMHLDVLGTYTGQMEYLLDEEGKLTATEDIFTVQTHHVLTVKRELPVTIDGANSSLPAGTKLLITGTDNADTACFTVQDSGQTGTISYTKNPEGWGILIDGVSEYEFFEDLPYAG